MVELVSEVVEIKEGVLEGFKGGILLGVALSCEEAEAEAEVEGRWRIEKRFEGKI